MSFNPLSVLPHPLPEILDTKVSCVLRFCAVGRRDANEGGRGGGVGQVAVVLADAAVVGGSVCVRVACELGVLLDRLERAGEFGIGVWEVTHSCSRGRTLGSGSL